MACVKIHFLKMKSKFYENLSFHFGKLNYMMCMCVPVLYPNDTFHEQRMKVDFEEKRLIMCKNKTQSKLHKVHRCTTIQRLLQPQRVSHKNKFHILFRHSEASKLQHDSDSLE
ncbi:CLUMA_CG001734, isoform A [Clunio marinus]|uniref:CLUMA_CG001734, isoform A n=1 Tax=Clunio marinus TaxID=568069 RepID=A0A1J1HKK9_9DIPT|nr:CLUMA_CG001734, isoform A [Clunio marinus]